MSAVFGSGDYTYEVAANWGRSAQHPALGLISGVACDSQDRVYAFQRTPRPIMLVFAADGRLVTAWGEDTFVKPHGVWIGPDDLVYCTDTEAHTVTKWTRDGELLATWGTPGQPGAPGMPFNQPARAVQSPQGEVFIADGYGQHRVHRFSADGQRQHSWGEEGAGPGQFGWPVHSAWVDPRGRVLITDRGNNRVQHFTTDGEYVGEWADLASPNDVFVDSEGAVYVAEGHQRITIMNLDGAVLARWGEQGHSPGQFAASPHCLWVDSRGDIYVGEVVTENRFQKFIRQR